MSTLIAGCGLNCFICEARVATVKNDNGLRRITAEKWRVMYRVKEMTPEMINCTGCREEGVKFSHCNVCEIRKCADSKGFVTCGECLEMEKCETVGAVHKYVPEAIVNLRNLRYD
jgi:hypothetical protein